MIKKTSYEHLYHSIISQLPVTPEYIRDNFTRAWEALDVIIERDYELKDWEEKLKGV